MKRSADQPKDETKNAKRSKQAKETEPEAEVPQAALDTFLTNDDIQYMVNPSDSHFIGVWEEPPDKKEGNNVNRLIVGFCTLDISASIEKISTADLALYNRPRWHPTGYEKVNALHGSISIGNAYAEADSFELGAIGECYIRSFSSNEDCVGQRTVAVKVEESFAEDRIDGDVLLEVVAKDINVRYEWTGPSGSEFCNLKLKKGDIHVVYSTHFEMNFTIVPIVKR